MLGWLVGLGVVSIEHVGTKKYRMDVLLFVPLATSARCQLLPGDRSYLDLPVAEQNIRRPSRMRGADVQRSMVTRGVRPSMVTWEKMATARHTTKSDRNQAQARREGGGRDARCISSVNVM